MVRNGELYIYKAVVSLPQGHLAMCGGTSGVRTGVAVGMVGNATGGLWVEARGAVEHPPVPRPAPLGRLTGLPKQGAWEVPVNSTHAGVTHGGQQCWNWCSFLPPAKSQGDGTCPAQRKRSFPPVPPGIWQ